MCAKLRLSECNDACIDSCVPSLASDQRSSGRAGAVSQLSAAKVTQNHETKEERVKNPSKVLPSHIFCVPLHSTISHKTAGDSESGAHSCVPLVASERSSSGKQFIAERGIEYGLQFVARPKGTLARQEPCFSSIPQTAFIQRKAENSYKVTKKLLSLHQN